MSSIKSDYVRLTPDQRQEKIDSHWKVRLECVNCIAGNSLASKILWTVWRSRYTEGTRDTVLLWHTFTHSHPDLRKIEASEDVLSYTLVHDAPVGSDDQERSHFLVQVSYS